MITRTLPEGNKIYIQRYLKFVSTIPQRGDPTKHTAGFDRHHIIPVSLGGKKGYQKKENLVLLSPREHYIAHLMLWKAFGGAMAHAFWMMNHIATKKLTSRQYDKLREEISSLKIGKLFSEEHYQHVVLANRNFGPEARANVIASNKLRSGVPLSKDHKKNISEANKGRVISEEAKKKISEAKKGKVIISEEQRIKISLANKARKGTKYKKKETING
jgi:hypothetical protein